LFSGIVAANFFLLGFLLAGTLTDFKESERLVVELASSLESIADECSLLRKNETARETRACLESTLTLTHQIRRWFTRHSDTRELMDGVSDLNHRFSMATHYIAAASISRLKADQAAIRRALLRIETIQDTSFIAAGFVISEIASVALIVGLVFAKMPSVYEGIFFLAALGALLVYTVLLIRDLDDPFEYDAKGAARGIADVSLKPLFDVETRIKRRIDRLPAVVESVGLDPSEPKGRRLVEFDDIEPVHAEGGDDADVNSVNDE
jgi:hypothetical protein